uniref:Uncharacterized protein n=1 Tax=Ciona intestinalis TaxID=7719 RepID=H2XZA0_CIOIN
MTDLCSDSTIVISYPLTVLFTFYIIVGCGERWDTFYFLVPFCSKQRTFKKN